MKPHLNEKNIYTNITLKDLKEELKLKYRDKISLADAFLIALTRQVKGIALTTDPAIKEILKNKCKLFEI